MRHKRRHAETLFNNTHCEQGSVKLFGVRLFERHPPLEMLTVETANFGSDEIPHSKACLLSCDIGFAGY